MPNPFQAQPVETPKYMLDFMDRIPADSLSAEIAALRQEIRELREALTPTRSMMIITGDAVDQFMKQMKWKEVQR